MVKFYERAAEQLSGYIKQVAWLNTAPNPPPSAKTSQATSNKTMTRLQQLEANARTPELPDAGPGAYLVGYLFDAGPVGQGGMGPATISHNEIAAWQNNTGIELTAWEARTLRALSADYIAASKDAQAHDAPPPYTAEPEPEHRAAVANQVRGIFAARAQPTQRH